MPATQKLPAKKIFLSADQSKSDFLWLSAADNGADGKKLKKFSMTAYTGGAMRVGYGYPVVVDLAGMSVASQKLPILKDHDPKLIAGHSTEITKQKSALILAGMMSGVGDAAKEVLDLAANDFPWQASIGAAIEKMEFFDRGESITVNGQSFTGPVYVARQSRLVEVSFVAIGADNSTSAKVFAKGSTMPTDVTLENEPSSTVLAMRAQAADEAAEGERIQYVNARFNSPALQAHRAEAISAGWTRKQVDDRVAVETLRASRPHSPGIHVVNREADADIITASLCRTAGANEKFLAAAFGEKVTDEALSARHRGMGLHSLCAEVVRAAGHTMPTGRFGGEHIKAAFEADRMLRASFSTVSLTGILSNAGNKILREAWDAVAVVWPFITGRADAKDFKPFKSFRLVGKGQFEKIAPDGKIKHIHLSETESSNQVSTFGAILSLTRHDIINDDLNAFAKVPRTLGHMAQTNIEEIVLETLLDAGTFFSVGNKNLLTGTANALSINGLTAAEAQFSKQLDANGKLLLLQAKTLLVPTALKVTAKQLTRETSLVGVVDEAIPGSNPHGGMFVPVSSPHLDSDGPLGGGSNTAYFLFADPMVCAAIEIAFLNGQELPIIETAMLTSTNSACHGEPITTWEQHWPSRKAR